MAKLKFKNGIFYVGKEPLEGVYKYNISSDFDKYGNPNLHITIETSISANNFNEIDN